MRKNVPKRWQIDPQETIASIDCRSRAPLTMTKEVKAPVIRRHRIGDSLARIAVKAISTTQALS